MLEVTLTVQIPGFWETMTHEEIALALVNASLNVSQNILLTKQELGAEIALATNAFYAMEVVEKGSIYSKYVTEEENHCGRGDAAGWYCTLGRGHAGYHVATTSRGRVLSQWLAED